MVMEQLECHLHIFLYRQSIVLLIVLFEIICLKQYTVKHRIKDPVNFDFRLKCFLYNWYLEQKSG